MTDIFKKPVIQFRVENPHLRMGKSLSWISIEADGYMFLSLSCPRILGWKSISLWITKPTEVSIAAPVNAILIANYWYLFGVDRKEFKVDDSEWMIKTPTSKDMSNLGVRRINLKPNNIFRSKKLLSYKKASLILNIQNSIKKYQVKHNLNPNIFQLSLLVPNIKNIINIKRSTLNKRMFYKKGDKNE